MCAFQPWQNTQYDKICKEFGIKVQTSHQPACPWSNKPLCEDIVFGGRTSLIYDKSDFVNTFFDLLKTFASEKTPVIEVPGGALTKIWPILGVIFKSVRNRRSADFRDNELALSVGNVSLILLSLFGWRKSEDSLPTVHCNLCLRTLGLWNFRCLEPEVSTTVLDIEENQYSWEDGRSYLLFPPEDGSSTATSPDSRSRELSSASEVSHSFPSGDSTVQNSPDKEGSGLSSPAPADCESGDAEMVPVPEVPTGLSETSDDPLSVPFDGKSDSSKDLVKNEDFSPNKSDGNFMKSEAVSELSPTKFEGVKVDKAAKVKSPEVKEPVKFGNPDIFLPVASYVLFQPRSSETDDQKKSDDSKVEEATEESPPRRSTRSRISTSPNKKQFKTPKSNTPTSRLTRSRSKVGSGETTPSPRGSGPRKRKAKTSESPPATRTTRLTRSASGSQSPCVTPPVKQTRKRRKSKLEVTESLVNELMKSSPTQLDLSASNPSNLNVFKQHHYWCPWVCTLPSYHINKAYRNTPTRLVDQGHTKVSVVDQTDTIGWETLLFHLSTVKSPGNAWIAVHNMLEDCVSQRK